jgi:DNA (cytosine-5)-methyltransferase 1
MRSIELFAGAGGLGLGVSRAGFFPAAVIEWDRYCCDTIRENQERRLEPVAHWPLVEGDVRDIDFTTIKGEIDFISGRKAHPCENVR